MHRKIVVPLYYASMRITILACILAILAFSAHAQTETGIASYYGKRFHGKKTASGELFDKDQLTAAHRTLPFGTVVKVTAEHNGESVYVRINDRGPFTKNRLIDVSRKAAEKLGIVRRGHGEVVLEVMGAEYTSEVLESMAISSEVNNRLSRLPIQQLEIPGPQVRIVPVLMSKPVNMKLPVAEMSETFIRKVLQGVFPDS